MSVQNQTVKNVYDGNGSATVFPFTFALNADDGEYVGVYVTNDAGTSETTDNFTIDADAKTVTYPKVGDPLPEGKKIVIRREIPNEQDLNLENLGPFFAEDIEGALDKLVMMIQQLAEAIARAVKVDMASIRTPDEFMQDIADAVQTAKDYADEAKDSAGDADASVTNAAYWAEGTDGQVAPLGGTHSAKGWADVSKGHSDDASGHATAASGSATNAAYWAEGTDGQVAPLGGTHSAKGWAEEAQTSADAAAAAASTVVAAHNNSPNAHADLLHLRQNSKVYAVGDIAFSASLPSYLVLECTRYGTTAETEPDFSGAVEGGTVTDGTVVWTYKTLVGGGLDREQIPAFNHRDVITTSGTYTAPVTGWYKITIKGGGGGGAGGDGRDSIDNINSGGSGGEGGTTIAYEYMTENDSSTVVIGGGGAGGSVGNIGADGGDSVVSVNSNTYTAGGGKTPSQRLLAGSGGTGTIIGCAGNSAEHCFLGSSSGTNQYNTGGGNGGGANGSSGINGGGGCGGYSSRVSTDAVAGSSGGDGFVWFEYFDASLNP